MSGTMPAAYWRAYRQRRRLAGRPVHRRPGYVRHRDYRAEYARKVERHPLTPRVEPLMSTLQRGVRLAFWDDELRLDLAQERSLALLEGRDPERAVAVYRARETAWRAITAPLLAVA